MYQLPKELQALIYSFDNTYKLKFNFIIKEFNNKINNLDFYEIINQKITHYKEELNYDNYDDDFKKYLTYDIKMLKLDMILCYNSFDNLSFTPSLTYDDYDDDFKKYLTYDIKMLKLDMILSYNSFNNLSFTPSLTYDDFDNSDDYDDYMQDQLDNLSFD
jgi:hypothetical protein